MNKSKEDNLIVLIFLCLLGIFILWPTIGCDEDLSKTILTRECKSR